MATFKDGVQNFWKWFPDVAQRFYATINEGNCEQLTDEVSQFMQENLPGLAWSFGPGEGHGHAFTISGEGILAKQLLAVEWLRYAPEIEGWTFYGSRQPGVLDSMRLDLGDAGSVDGSSLIIQTHVDDEAQAIDVVAWHPAFDSIPEDAQHQVLFLMLDEALGEFGTQTWIGEIKIEAVADDAPHVRRLEQLPDYIRSVEAYHQWEKLVPTESYSSYQLPEQYPGPRGDTLVGTTLLPHPFIDYIIGEGELEDNPLEGTGAELAYIAFDGTTLPEGDQANVRAMMEDAIDEALQEKGSGRVLGGAHGSEHAYIDLILFDGKATQELVLAQIDKLLIPSATLHVIA